MQRPAIFLTFDGMRRFCILSLLFLLACGKGKHPNEELESEGTGPQEDQDRALQKERASKAREKKLNIDTLVSIASSIEKRSLQVSEELQGSGALEKEEERSPLLVKGQEKIERSYLFDRYRAAEFKSVEDAKRTFERLKKERNGSGGKGEGGSAYAHVDRFILRCQLPCPPTPKEDAKYRAWRKWVASLGTPSGHFLESCKDNGGPS